MGKLRLKQKHLHTGDIRRKLPVEDRELLPTHIDIPDVPTYARDKGEREEWEEQQVARVEHMMMRGIRNKRQLMTVLEVSDGRVMDRFIKRVHARWEMIGSAQDFVRHRGEALTRLDAVESEMWSKLSNLEMKAHPQVALNYLTAILKLSEHRASVLGLSPKVIAHIGINENGGTEFAKRVVQHDRLLAVASRMHEMIEDRCKVIDHEGPAS